MSSAHPIRVFIGSGEQSRLERKTLIYSLKKNSTSDLDIYVFNGSHNSIERNDEPPVLAPMPLHIKYLNRTEFTLYRYLIPELCGHEGRAIYLDSDMVCLGDIAELFHARMDGCDFLSKRRAASEGDGWGPSVMLIDCARCRFDLEEVYREIQAGLYTLEDFMCFREPFLRRRPYAIGELDPHWNVFDRYDERTKLIHYTNLSAQPWRYPNHPYGDLWFAYFEEAIAAGFITEEDIRRTIARGAVRKDIREGNSPRRPTPGRALLSQMKRVVRAGQRRLGKPAPAGAAK